MLSLTNKKFKILAPIDGRTIELSAVPDPVFAEKMVGDGIAIDTSGNIAAAPVDGVLSLVFRTNHAFGITLDNGIELLVHIGIDTVELEGEGFERIAEEGKRVKAGEPIIKIDREFVEGKGFSLITPVLITNMDRIKKMKCYLNKVVRAGSDEVINYRLK